jgi:hypothetical protein
MAAFGVKADINESVQYAGDTGMVGVCRAGLTKAAAIAKTLASNCALMTVCFLHRGSPALGSRIPELICASRVQLSRIIPTDMGFASIIEGVPG